MATQEELERFYMSNKTLRDSAGNVDRSALKDWNAHVRQMTKALESATGGIVKVIKTLDEKGNALATFDVSRSQKGNAQAAFDRVLGNIETIYDYQKDSLLSEPYTSGLNKSEAFRRISYHKTLHGATAKRSAKEAIKEAGGTITEDPTRKNKDRMRIDFAVSESEWNSAVSKAKGDESKAITSLSRKFTRANLKQAEKYSSDVQTNQQEKEEADKKKREEKEAKSNRAKFLQAATAIVSLLAAISDIVRRILTASLARASDIKREAVNAKSLGISYASSREYRAQEEAMGLDKGTFTSAMAELQSGVGDISNLDTNMLQELAKVMKGDVVEAIKAGLGQNDLENLMKSILNAYFERGQKGVNSVGLQVGRYQAERELATALEKAGLGKLAEVLRNMFYTQDTGIYKGRLSGEDAFASYMELITAYTMGFNGIDDKKFSELGQVVDEVKMKFNLLKENLEKLVLTSISGLITKIDNWDIGKSPKEKSAENKLNKELNEKAEKDMLEYAKSSEDRANQMFAKAGIDFSPFGKGATATTALAKLQSVGFDMRKLTEGEQSAYYDMLQYARTEQGKEAVNALLGADVARERAKQAREDIVKGTKNANIQYRKADYTPSSVQSEVQNAVMELYENNQTSAINFDYNTPDYTTQLSVAGVDMPAITLLNNAMRAKGKYGYENEAIYNQIANEFYGGEITYDKVLETGKASRLIEKLFEMIPEEYRTTWGLTEGKKKKAIKDAMESGILSEENVKQIMLENMEAGFGLTQAQIDSARHALNQIESERAGEGALVSSIFDKARGTEEAKRYIGEHNTENVVMTIPKGSYSAKEGRVNVVLSVKGKDGIPDKVISVYTDEVAGKEMNFEQDISSVVNKAQINGSNGF